MPGAGQGALSRPQTHRQPSLRGRFASLLLSATLATQLFRPDPALAEVPGDCLVGTMGAMYNSSTTRYSHAVLGGRSEWTALTVFIALGPPCRAGSVSVTLTLPVDMVFEDADPILADLTGDGDPEILVVESQRDRGARLAVYTRDGAGVARLAATPYIGTRHRWLAQLGAADLDGDGRLEIAYIDRPHLARVLRLWGLEGQELVPVASAEGLTNHRFGEPTIQGGIRQCPGAGPEIIAASADWSRLLAVSWDGASLHSRQIGSETTPEAFARAMACG